ncbi:ATP-binding protein [Exiguobacterium sp. SH1S4]|nr:MULTISPECIES: AAA family ATPase [unclassified Exiguobacterium]TCI68854.1 ATP-binding protein [Exiguobacterium sp. SH1S1]TCI43599.1 ATP-binding protein [Exiguobacterium sp. SH5S32]TCI52545.1 ATP-binding protein [Exiguobacterium sp. SH1S4]TCI65317.1 ATP-binding protein [Exiguobacterium sp. SH0S2]TCI80263.1 ATP-binding protein [Exiguobacterium sp. SH0S1]
MFFLQMSGFPGSGKSTLARAIAPQLNAVIVDHDVTKTALLESMVDHKLDPALAGKVAYDIDWALVAFNLSLGRNVILDSPCLYDVMLERGLALAENHGATYRYVECVVDDVDEINRRLSERERKISQIESVSPDDFHRTVANRKKPDFMHTLTIDANRPIETYLTDVISYVQQIDG